MELSHLHCESILSLSKEEQAKLAKKYSERNKELEKLLLFLWENNILTYSTCGGHKYIKPQLLDNGIIRGQENVLSKISFNIDNFSNSQIENLIRYLLSTFENKLEFYIKNTHNKNKISKLMSINFNFEIRESGFIELKNIIQNILNNVLMFSELNDFNNTLIKDILTILSYDFEKYVCSNPLENVTALWLRRHEDNTILFGFGTEEIDNKIHKPLSRYLYNQLFNEKYPYNSKHIITLSKNTYRCFENKYLVFKDNDYEIVDYNYVLKNKLVEYGTYLLSLSSYYTHILFVHRIKEAQNHNLF